MRAIVSRVAWAKCEVDGQVVGECGPGFLVLVAASKTCTEETARRLADRVSGLRILNDASGKMNLGLDSLPNDNGPKVLVVSNFTLFGDAWASRRPSFTKAASYEDGEKYYKIFVDELRKKTNSVECGVFGADMKITSLNDGPVTLVIDA